MSKESNCWRNPEIEELKKRRTSRHFHGTGTSAVEHKHASSNRKITVSRAIAHDRKMAQPASAEPHSTHHGHNHRHPSRRLTFTTGAMRCRPTHGIGGSRLLAPPRLLVPRTSPPHILATNATRGKTDAKWNTPFNALSTAARILPKRCAHIARSDGEVEARARQPAFTPCHSLLRAVELALELTTRGDTQ